MAHFQFQALDAQRQLVTGQLHADSVAQALAKLEARGLTVQSINYVFADPIDAVLAPGPAADASAEQAALHAHLVRVLERSRPMVPALRAFAEELPSGRPRRQLDRAIGVLERGDPAAARADLARLPEFWVPLLGAASVSGDPGRILSQFLDETRQAAELRRQWWQSLAYPLLIVHLAVAVFMLLSIAIIPGFREMFIEFDLPLPAPTIFVLNAGTWFAAGWILIPLLLMDGMIVFWDVFSTTAPAGWRGTVYDLLGMPFGRSVAVARLSTFAADLLEAGLEVPTALRVAGYCTQSPRLQRAAWRLAQEAERHDVLPHFDRPQPLTHTVVLALRGPLHDAARIRVLREVGHSHAERARTRLSWTRGLMEPLAIIAIGLVVGFIALSLFLPLIRLVQGLSGGLA